MNEKNKSFWKGYIASAAVTTVAMSFGGPIIDHFFFDNKNLRVPINQTIEEGHVNPASLEFNLVDLDNNGSQESIVTLNDTNYLFKYENGNPVLQRYEVTSPQIIPKN